ncbi:MAG: glycosyltransferase family 8 protein [Hymenobacter sp.]|nr:MAG: glycosyltransferase family 8 protein [Hymenobacter sp.]
MATEINHLAVAFDQNYVTPFYVLATSVFANNLDSNFHIHAIVSGLSEQDKATIRQFVEQYHSSISFYELTPEDIAGLVLPKEHYFTAAVYYRLFFPVLVPNTVEKLLYLDTDIVVIGNLSEVFHTALGNYPAGAVAEVTATKNRPDLGIYEIGSYFNSGVMLMNVPEWRKQAISEKAIQFVRNFPEKIVWPDQDALNVALQGNYIKLSNRFNVIPSDIPKYLPRAEYARYLRGKVIIHYTLKQHKPWNIDSENKFRYLYHHYRKSSPRAREKKYKDTAITARRFKTFVKLRSLELLLGIPKLAALLTLLVGEDTSW